MLQTTTTAVIVTAMILISGRLYGRTIDIECRESKGHPALIDIPDSWKPIFCFRWDAPQKVALCAVCAEVIAMVCALALAIVLVLSHFSPAVAAILRSAVDIIFISYVVLALIATVPTEICCMNAEMVQYDLDITSSMQHSVGLLKKRRCRVISEQTPGVYQVRFGYFGRRIHLATATIPVEIGRRYYAVHFYEDAPYFWTIRNH
jgi:hypothetical protein